MQSSEMRRVVLLGHPLVGKSTVIQALGDLKKASFELISVELDVPIYDRGVRISWQEEGISCEVSTLAGSVWDYKSWRTISAPNCRYILLIDIQAVAVNFSLLALVAALQLELGPLAAVQITKADLIENGPTIDLKHLRSGFQSMGLPCFISRHDDPATQVAACCHVLGVSLP